MPKLNDAQVELVREATLTATRAIIGRHAWEPALSRLRTLPQPAQVAARSAIREMACGYERLVSLSRVVAFDLPPSRDISAAIWLNVSEYLKKRGLV